MLSDLNPLLLDLTGLDDQAIEALGCRIYNDIYLQTFNRGILKTHDGEDVYFYRNVGHQHALHKTIQDNKDTICPLRVERVKWIKEFIEGNVADSECWLVIDRRGFEKRLYCSFRYSYVVWLAPRDEGWSFKSSYPVSPAQIRGYIRNATLLCRFALPTEPPPPSSRSDSASLLTDASPVPVPPCSLPDGLVPAREDSSRTAGSSPSDPS
jgi:hypothetical protein